MTPTEPAAPPFGGSGTRDALLAAAADSSHDAVFVLDGSGSILAASARAEMVLGHHPSALLGRGFASLVVAAGREALERRIASAAAGADVFQHDTCATHVDGRPVDITINMAPVRLPSSGMTACR